jgi:cytochrome b subunit of formate dehydrogenase
LSHDELRRHSALALGRARPGWHFRLPSSSRSDAKRHNEGLKLLAAFLNAIAIALVVTGVVVPITSGLALGWAAVAWIGGGLALHYVAQLVIRSMRPEE